MATSDPQCGGPAPPPSPSRVPWGPSSRLRFRAPAGHHWPGGTSTESHFYDSHTSCRRRHKSAPPAAHFRVGEETPLPLGLLGAPNPKACPRSPGLTGGRKGSGGRAATTWSFSGLDQHQARSGVMREALDSAKPLDFLPLLPRVPLLEKPRTCPSWTQSEAPRVQPQSACVSSEKRCHHPNPQSQ